MFTSSADPTVGRGAKGGLPLPLSTLAGLLLAGAAVVLIAYLSFRSLQERSRTAVRVTTPLQVVLQIDHVTALLSDAEAGQRGSLLLGDDTQLEHLERAQTAIDADLVRLRALILDSEQQRRLDSLIPLISEEMTVMGRIAVFIRSGAREKAIDLVGHRSEVLMHRIRGLLAEMRMEEQAILARRQQEWWDAVSFSTRVTWGGSALLVVLIVLAAAMASRDYRTREAQSWARAGQMLLSERMQGDLRLEKLTDNVLTFLAQRLGAQVGALYVLEPDGRYRRTAGYALPAAYRDRAVTVDLGEGLAGQVAKEAQPRRVPDVPEGYLPVSSSLGESHSRELLIAPAMTGGAVQAVIELGFLQPTHPLDLRFLTYISESVAVGIRSARDRTRLEELLAETQRQSEELQTQQEELRVSNEELIEQGRVLQESQGRLQAQQTELEQTNSQLEEQAQILEAQKDDLTRARGALAEKADELERSNQYKSEFLANMSHELRTPLNSSLILANLLADNKDGNLSAEQVKYAQTISSAGQDLLSLINDILDLSKIEAGKMEVQTESVVVGRAVDALSRSLQPLAQEKGLGFRVIMEPGTPERMETDGQRLAQILRNLLSNALKFTERGEVTLRIAPSPGDAIAFAVTDTGIGIPAPQQEIIFEAFRQADGSTHRKYGGTGLGLSISRDLARLLGGNIAVQSQPGQGSTFTLTLPRVHVAQAVQSAGTLRPSGAVPASSARPADVPGRATPAGTPTGTPTLGPPGPLAPPRPVVPAPRQGPLAVPDDRDQLAESARVILIIEDDLRFAAILKDLAHEMGFQCVITHTANEGLAAAREFHPSAIVLDMNLPDHSGLGVLDQLKRDARTRHIPVHIASVVDHAHEARELGAVGYVLKPVKREELVEALRRLEARFSQKGGRVLVVEDDPRQRESIQQLLGADSVEIVGVENAGQALAQLQTSTFDCMVMDLNLPDLSGYELLEKMAEQEQVSFPPVIVYTGRSLTRDEEHRLRRFSRSIIIKDARSPERLLDEVTLFLHQVESKLPPERQRMLKEARAREATLEGRRILVVEDDVRNIFALSSVLEPKGARVEIARNGKEALDVLSRDGDQKRPVDLVLMDIMMPEMDGLTAMREIRKRPDWQKLPIIALTAKAMRDDQEKCLAAGANDYIAKPLDVEKLLSLVRVWMPKQ